MNLTSKRTVKNLLKKYQTRPSKKLGQNFLIDKNVVKKFIKACNLKSKDIVLEIGPGIGTLTQEIAKKVKRVVAVEKDPKMCEILKETLKDFENIDIVQKDILKFKVPKSKIQMTNSYRAVGNLPFYLTVPVIRKFLERKNPPKEMVLFVQKEVGQRICANPPKMSILAVSVQFYAKPEIVAYVSKKSFWPQPKVDSAIVRITQLLNADKRLINADLFFKVVKAGFSHPRKQLINNFSKELEMDKEKVENWLLKNEIEPKQRAESLSVQDWIKLIKSLK